MEQVAQMGHLIGNHTYNHPDLARKAAKAAADEINMNRRCDFWRAENPEIVSASVRELGFGGSRATELDRSLAVYRSSSVGHRRSRLAILA